MALFSLDSGEQMAYKTKPSSQSLRLFENLINKTLIVKRNVGQGFSARVGSRKKAGSLPFS